MESIILMRLNNGDVVAISDDDKITVFSDFDKAVDLAESHPLCQAVPYQIVELDEL